MTLVLIAHAVLGRCVIEARSIPAGMGDGVVGGFKFFPSSLRHSRLDRR